MKGLLPATLLLTSTALSAVVNTAIAADAAVQTAPANRYANRPFPGAEATVTALLSKDLSDREAQTLFGHLFARHDDFETVVELLEERADEQPEAALVQLRFGQAACQLAGHPDTGMLGKAGLAGDCRDALEKASELDPKLLNAWRGLFDFYRQAPGVVGGGIDKAEAVVAKIALIDPAEAEQARATLAGQQEQYDKMRGHFAKAAELNPAKAEEFRFRESMALVRAKQYEAAYEVLGSLLKTTDTELAAQVQYQLGRTAVIAANPAWCAAAEGHLQAYLARTDLTTDMPAKSWAAFRLGQVYELMGKAELSRQQYLWAAGQQPDEPLKAELKKKGIKA
ncbi:MAG TPA: hypothetical protein VFV64_11270 [Permianibacter sp.]|nr:hypothetical protein [Permianibacter sp.]